MTTLDARRRRPGPADALIAAERAFMTGDRVDVQALAAELGVNRITVYRWVGTRDALLSQVMTRLAERTLRRAAGDVPPGVSRAAHALHAFAEASVAHPGVQRMWREEAALFTRLTVGLHSSFQARLVAVTEELLARDLEEGRVDLPGGAEALQDFAFAAVRVTETFVHTEALTGAAPDAGRCARVLNTLLRAR